MSKNTNIDFSKSLLTWFKQHGRHDLPWQQPREAYRVWLSEIMLQQTQVQTVIPYFERFINEFPSLQSLAKASQDEVLHQWTGLGYYARARNLHKTAQIIVEQHGAKFPQDYDDILALPGIGPSTAAAILAQAFDLPHAILDGNVKRVLTRFHTISGWPGKKKIEVQLWDIARQHTPNHSAADYTQAIMDLGATVCTRSKPSCKACPMSASCAAYKQGNPGDYPTPKKRASLPVRKTTMLLLQNIKGEILLQQRPAQGIWGNLWSLPEIDDSESASQISRQQFACEVETSTPLSPFRHTFSHFHLDIQPIHCKVSTHTQCVMDSSKLVWYKCVPPDNQNRSDKRGLPGPVKKLLETTLEKNP
ncbi:A/G-specific adenine glycosylase [hydrothermal vent metagenome]|uniref:Adenine DNA glycosylase n=1 Tax=hydrothermal vent metagenome TaxID=652676 RepID=A0A3B1AB92_9ZZZZ